MEVNISARICMNLTITTNAQDFLYSSSDKLIITAIIPIISLIGIFGNGVFLFVSCRVLEIRSAFVTPYVVNLAVCDILFLLFINGWYIVAFISNPWFYALPVVSTFGCASYVISTHFWYLTSLGLITLISAERYLAICKPLLHRAIRGKPRNMKLISGTWVLAFIITLTLIPQSGKFVTNCVMWPDIEKFEYLPRVISKCEPLSRTADIYVSLFIIISFVLILAVNSVLFVKTSVALKSLSSTNSDTERIRCQVTRTLMANGVVFFVCQLPYRIYALDDVFDKLHQPFDILSEQAELTVVLIGLTFLYLNSIINPYLYVCMCQHYRAAMVKEFCGWRTSGTERER